MKILIVQTSFLGDTILSTPVISAVHHLHPKAEIWMMTTPLSSKLVENDPLLSGVIPFDKRGKQKGIKGLLAMAETVRKMDFSVVYSLHRSIRTSTMLAAARIPLRYGFSNAKGRCLYHKTFQRDPGLHDVLRNLAILGAKNLPQEMRLFVPPDACISKTILEALPEKPFVLLVPGSAWKTKRWHPKGYREVARRFLELGTPVVTAGGPEERSTCQEVADGLSVVNLAGKTGIGEMIWVAKKAKLIICNDSMALHMASALKIPNVAIFCSTVPAFGFGPWKNRAKVVEKEMDCRPCGRHGKKECPENTEACMKEITADKVMEAAQNLLSGEAP